LFNWCESWKPTTIPIDDKLWAAGSCRGYVSGVVDALLESTGGACVPYGQTGVTINQLVEVVKLYLKEHPEKRHLPASDLVIASMKDKFPCN
jgi:hypothetical protein